MLSPRQGGFAGVAQASNDDPTFGQGMEGYGRRYGAAFADQVSGEFWGTFFYPTLLQEDPRYYRKGHPPNQPRALLYLLATARARDYLRKGDKQPLWQRLFGRPAEPAVVFTVDDVTGLDSDTSQRALGTLEFGARAILLLRDYCGLSYDEVARAAGTGRTSVARDLDRARHEFKQAYDYIRF